ncbi:hypothetical protein BC827DRAFT_320221 [Russula dissimulans]|nr:hypothetical protein BC827DRAFT_320221 [Russula dissimulans]
MSGPLPNLPQPFTMNVYATGGGGGGGGGAGSGGNNDQDRGRGTTNPAHDYLIIRRQRKAIHWNRKQLFSQTESVEVVPVARIPKKVIFTANARNFGGDNNAFSFIADVLLVPTSFKMDSEGDLYQYLFPGSFMSPLRDNIISLLRISTHGIAVASESKRCDIPEDLRKKDYQLVVTCPTLQYGDDSSNLQLFFLVEMEF